MDNLDFLKLEEPVYGAATLNIRTLEGSLVKIDGLDLDIVAQSCPVLAFAFEPSGCGPRHNIEDTTAEAAISLLRYAYNRNYMPEFLDEPISLPIHLQICRLADIYDLSELKLQVRGRIIWECELSCGLPMPPLDLLEGIRYLYTHLQTESGIIDTIINYCVACLVNHSLDVNPAFLQLAFENRAFHRDLCRTNLNRGFADESAQAIVRLPVCPDIEGDQAKATTATRILGDYLYDMWNEPVDCHMEVTEIIPSPRTQFATDSTDTRQQQQQHEQQHFCPTAIGDTMTLPSRPFAFPTSEQNASMPPNRPLPPLPFRPALSQSEQRTDLIRELHENVDAALIAPPQAIHQDEDSDGFDLISAPSSPSVTEEDGYLIVPNGSQNI